MSGIMGFSFGAPSPKKRKQGDEADSSGATGSDGSKGGISSGQADNLDYRLRQVEAILLQTHKIPKEVAEQNPMIMAMLAGLARYKENEKPKEKKGEGHDWGPCRLTVALAWTAWICTEANKGVAAVTSTLAPVALKVNEHNQMATLAKGPTIEEQLQLLIHFGGTVSSDQKIATKQMDWMAHCEVHLTKKEDAYLVRFGIEPTNLLSCTAPLYSLLLEAAGSEILSGAAPRGPKFFKKKGGRK